MAARQYDIDPHFTRRLEQRRIPFRSVWYAIKNAVSCDPYVPERPPLRGGNSWRVAGPDHEGTMTSVGVETYVDHLGRRMLLVTVF